MHWPCPWSSKCPDVTAMGGAGRSFGIHRAMLQHVNLGCVSPQAWCGLHEQAGQNSVSAGRARLVWPLSLSWLRLQLFLTSPCHFGGASGSYCEVDIRVSCLSASPRGLRGRAWGTEVDRKSGRVTSADSCNHSHRIFLEHIRARSSASTSINCFGLYYESGMHSPVRISIFEPR